MLAAAAIVMVTAEPLIVTLPALVPCIVPNGPPPLVTMVLPTAEVETVPDAFNTTLPPLPLAPPAELIEVV
jgi:hypothetical protein